jgi:probable F420-dependent oxidoreductase
VARAPRQWHKALSFQESAMKLGTVYPQIELNGDPEAFRRIGLATEVLGYDHFLIYDHVVGAVHEGRDPPLFGGYNDKDPFHEPFVALSYLAGMTRRIGLVTGIVILPQRQTALAAKQAADLDILSGGRLRLGVGTGWNYVEYEALGQDFHTRGKKLDEQIPYLRRLWSEEAISFQGQFDRIDRANLVPRPKRQIPIWCGGFVEPAYRRAARLADGFIFATGFDDSTVDAWNHIRDLVREAGRPVDSFGGQFILQAWAGEVHSYDQIVDRLRQVQDAGATHAGIVSMGRGFTETDQHLDFFAEVKQRADAALG